MNKKTVALALAGVLAVGVAALVMLNRTASISPAPDQAAPATTTEPLATGTAPPPTAKAYRKWSLPGPRPAATTPPATPQLVELPGVEGRPAAQGVKIKADQVVATVNQIPITAADLVPVPASSADVTLDPAEYEARLAKAVDAEMTLQAARRQGVSLQPAQQDRIAAIAQRHTDAFAKYKEQGVTWSSVTPEQIALEERQLAASVLQQNLVLKQAGVGPSPDPAVQAKYEAALRTLLDQLRASAQITLAKPSA